MTGLAVAWLFKYFQIIKAKEKRGEVARNRQKVALITQEQITSISAPETDTNLPDRERERAEDERHRSNTVKEKERVRNGRTSNFLEVCTAHTHVCAQFYRFKKGVSSNRWRFCSHQQNEAHKGPRVLLCGKCNIVTWGKDDYLLVKVLEPKTYSWEHIKQININIRLLVGYYTSHNCTGKNHVIYSYCWVG